jgi:hypothetical protein
LIGVQRSDGKVDAYVRNHFSTCNEKSMQCPLSSEGVGVGGWGGEIRVARFFSVKHTKTSNNIPNNHKIYQFAIKYTVKYSK